MQRACPLVGLTGGIGTGKSTVAALMADQGAIVVDADAVAREVVARGSDGLARLVEEFGSQILQPDGSLDRAQLAAETFGDPAKLAVLNAVTHPLIGRRSAEAIAAIPADRIGVYDVALLIENNLHQVCDRVVVVTCPLDVRLERLERRGVVREDGCPVA